jgi:hypothetical protein
VREHSSSKPRVRACHAYRSHLPLGRYRGGMCRSIVTLRRPDQTATDEEIRAAALQYVRKISGSARPSKANEAAFERAVAEVTETSLRLLGELVTSAPPRNREVEAEKARARAEKRFGAAA